MMNVRLPSQSWRDLSATKVNQHLMSFMNNDLMECDIGTRIRI